MKYHVQANSSFKSEAIIKIKERTIGFGITSEADHLPNPAELFLGALAACMLKSVERFSTFMKFEYTNAAIEVHAVRIEKAPRMSEIRYHLTIGSKDRNINGSLLKKNMERYGTIYNTIAASCDIEGEIDIKSDQ